MRYKELKPLMEVFQMRKPVLALIMPVLGIALLAGCAGNRPTPTATPDQMELALSEQDIILEPLEGELSFIEPNPEDALILKDIHFAFDSSEIPPGDKPIIEDISDWMINHPDALLLVEGHCDERGTNEYNTALGERRGLGVRTSLTAQGTNPQRITTISYGEDSPLCSESNEECWAQNRRAHFKVDYGSALAGEPGAPEPIVLDDVLTETEEVTIYEEPVEVPDEELAPPPETATAAPAVVEEEEVSSDSSSRRRVIGRYHY